MRFTAAQILKAIRDPNYPNDPGGSGPIGMPWHAGGVGGDAVGGHYGMVSLQPDPSVILEVQSMMIQPVLPAAAQNVYAAVFPADVWASGNPTYLTTQAVVAVQEGNAPRFGKSYYQKGYLTVNAFAVLAQTYYGSQTGLIEFTQPITLIGGANAPRFTVVAVAAALVLAVTFQGREWPYDPSTY